MTASKWTPELVERLRAYNIAGSSMADAARAMGVTVSAARGATERYKIGFWRDPNFWSADETAALEVHRAAGLSMSEIAKAMGRTRSAIAGRFNRLGWSMPQARVQEIRRAERAARAPKPKRPVGRPAKPKAEKPLKPPKPEPIAPAPLRPFAPVVSIEALTLCSCRWPFGNPDEEGFGFCGQPKREGSSYCPGHHVVAYPPAINRKQNGNLNRGFERRTNQLKVFG